MQNKSLCIWCCWKQILPSQSNWGQERFIAVVTKLVQAGTQIKVMIMSYYPQ